MQTYIWCYCRIDFPELSRVLFSCSINFARKQPLHNILSEYLVSYNYSLKFTLVFCIELFSYATIYWRNNQRTENIIADAKDMMTLIGPSRSSVLPKRFSKACADTWNSYLGNVIAVSFRKELF